MILLAEDDEILNRMLNQLFESHGFLVLSAKDGKQALALFDANPGAIELVITDIEMPRMSGIELWTMLRKQHPELKILLMSATVPENELLDLPFGSNDKFVAKPFDIFAFLSIVENFISV
jgi:two-component system cell cycle sensor histidine kinase/response regulator CckA